MVTMWTNAMVANLFDNKRLFAETTVDPSLAMHNARVNLKQNIARSQSHSHSILNIEAPVTWSRHDVCQNFAKSSYCAYKQSSQQAAVEILPSFIFT